jgi:hypothetical protein
MRERLLTVTSVTIALVPDRELGASAFQRGLED